MSESRWHKAYTDFLFVGIICIFFSPTDQYPCYCNHNIHVLCGIFLLASMFC